MWRVAHGGGGPGAGHLVLASCTELGNWGSGGRVCRVRLTGRGTRCVGDGCDGGVAGAWDSLWGLGRHPGAPPASSVGGGIMSPGCRAEQEERVLEDEAFRAGGPRLRAIGTEPSGRWH